MRSRRYAPYLAAAAGGGIGASARYGLSLWWPADTDGASWPTATFVTNLTGCVLLGAALVIAMELIPLVGLQPWARLLRPFVITGVLGGYTTFSTFAVEVDGLLRHGASGMALTYVLGSVGLGVIAVGMTMAVGELVFDRIRRPGRGRGIRGGVVAVEESEAVTEEEA